MGRFVLMKRTDQDFDDDISKLDQIEGLQIIDTLDPKVLLVEANKDAIAVLKSSLPSIIVKEEVKYPKPDTHRPNIKP